MGCQGRAVGVVVAGLRGAVLDGGMAKVSWAVLKIGVKCIDLEQYDLTNLHFPRDNTLPEDSHL